MPVEHAVESRVRFESRWIAKNVVTQKSVILMPKSLDLYANLRLTTILLDYVITFAFKKMPPTKRVAAVELINSSILSINI